MVAPMTMVPLVNASGLLHFQSYKQFKRFVLNLRLTQKNRFCGLSFDARQGGGSVVGILEKGANKLFHFIGSDSLSNGYCTRRLFGYSENFVLLV